MLKFKYSWVLVMVFVHTMTPVFGQTRKNAFNIENNQMVLYLDLNLGRSVIDSILGIADIRGTNLDKLRRGDFLAIEGDGWTVRKLSNNQLLLLKPLDELSKNTLNKPLMIIENIFKGEKRPGYPGDVAFGMNYFAKQHVFEMAGGSTRFFLPGNLTAKKVILSGNFNDWSTLKGVMTKTDSGWIADVKLAAGQYLYKYVVNGRWIYDHDNLLRERDGFSDYNSIYFKYNYTFKLKGYQNAGRVMLAGSFNKFNANEIVLSYKNGIWQQSMYLKEATHYYNFLVDGKWITDPLNKRTINDGKGRVSSILSIGQEATFRLKGFDNATKVYLAGDFNNWNPAEIPLRKAGPYWLYTCTLPAGNYGYKFIVDGRWMTDPANPHEYSFNGGVNSLLVLKPTHTFVLKGYGNAKTVRIAGDFNDWNYTGYTLAHNGDEWRISLNLKPGKCLYKFIVDGNWMIDPGNKLWEQNQYDTGNSVLWVGP